MQMLIVSLLLPFCLFVSPAEEPAEATDKEIFLVQPGPFEATLEVDGIFLPDRVETFRFIPEVLGGAIQIEEVTEPGTLVREGQVLIRFKLDKVDEQIEQARLDLRVAQVQAEDARAKEALARVDLEANREKTRMDLEQAKKRLEGYQEVELPLQNRERALSFQFSEHSIADQQDELDQLGKMYLEDELTEETEEIVLKRSKRNLARSRNSLSIQRDRHEYTLGYSRPMTLALKLRDVADKKRALNRFERLAKSGVVLAGIEREKAEIRLKKAEKHLAGLEKDRASLVFKSSTEGILLHANSKLEGKPLKKGGRLAAYEPFMTVAEPGSLKVKFQVEEKDLFKLEEGIAVRIKPKAQPDTVLQATLNEISTLPNPQKKWTCQALLAEKETALLPGMSCQAEIVYLNLSNVLTVPLQAVTKEGENSFVQVLTPEGPVERQVNVGEANKDKVVVTEGLKEGDRVLI